MTYNYDETLKSEANAFDSQIIERVKNGHIPDLQNCEDCDYFYNNSWRRKSFVQLDFVEQFNLIKNSISDYFSQQESKKIRILEVGCGPGFMSLELARNGFDTIGLDISSDCIAVAINTAEKYSKCHKKNLHYVCTDILSFAEQNSDKFEVILFVGALHHFPDQAQIHALCSQMLVNGGLFICHEPVRDKIDKSNAVISSLITTILSKCGLYYDNTNSAPAELAAMQKYIEEKYKMLRYESDSGEKLQAVNDNEAGYSEMYPYLESNYQRIVFEWRYGLFHELIGGLRLGSEELNSEVASIIKSFDEIMCKEGIINSTEFFYVGRIDKNSI
jgi:2-polyprenyl-3-methyl-5-hydroxy-6-metoxy-1,4-benzoquinol methylase